jgi:hypothetical protein
MQTLDKVLAPLRNSRDAIVPYVESIQSGYHEASDKARALVRHPPKSMRMLANRYVVISLVAGACLFAASRLRNWRNQAAVRARHAASRASSAARKTSRAAARGTRAAARAARVH